MHRHKRKDRPFPHLVREQRSLDDCKSLDHSRMSRKFCIKVLLGQYISEHSRPIPTTKPPASDTLDEDPLDDTFQHPDQNNVLTFDLADQILPIRQSIRKTAN